MKPTPVYQQIADDLRRQIADGTFPPGAQIPTEAELLEKYGELYGVRSRQTVRQGLAVIVNEGIIEARRPKGYFVIKRRRLVYRPQAEFRQKPPEVDIFTNLIQEEDGRTPSQDIEVVIVEPTAVIREHLGLAPGELVAARRRIRRLDGEAYNLNDSYTRLSLVQGTDWMHPGDVTRGTDAVLGELGHELVYGFHEFYLRMPTPDEIQRLGLGPGVPVAEHLSTAFDAIGPVQITVNVIPGDRHVIVFETHRDVEANLPRIPWGAP
ncbi:GntR family transcriptional regulator [Streptomyces niveiscabiei]|uniref:GntR family transcriptional regulator n=1 Tax=Streptomyces niveiscabiei TaxID=164115 RepID=UPI0006EB310B|nr:GntR family transcriptional regulator [Streptomyces niveiscabiei]